MADTTSVDPIRFRELARILAIEAQTTDERTPAGGLTTIAAALGGSLIAECHGAVSVDIRESQADVARLFVDEIDSLRSAADIFDAQELANTTAIGSAGAPR